MSKRSTPTEPVFDLDPSALFHLMNDNTLVTIAELMVMAANRSPLDPPLRGSAALWDKNTAGRVLVNMSKDGIALWDSKTGISHRLKKVAPVDMATLSKMLRNLKETAEQVGEQQEGEMEEYEMGPTTKVPNISGMKVEDAAEAIKIWFDANFEDPAEGTSYCSAEGGYLYLCGGPYLAAEEIASAFGSAITDEILDAAVELIEADGIDEWAANACRMQPEVED